MRQKVTPFFLLAAIVFLLFSPNAFSIDHKPYGYDVLNESIMRPGLDTIMQWIGKSKLAPKAHMDSDITEWLKLQRTYGVGTPVDLLPYLDYDPIERDQKSCGNCWNWAGQGVVGIALSVQESIKTRLSTQYLDSCEVDQFACCGGTLDVYADWYKQVGMTIPWSNANALFADGNALCNTGQSSVTCSSISVDPSYLINDMQVVTIDTSGGQDNAIANIKNVLNQNRAIWFGFFLPNQADWNQFFNFWSGASASEETIFDLGYSDGHTWDASGGGHAVLLVGYNDQDPNPDNHYWIFLNSWGTAGGKRPNGLFRLKMHMNYDLAHYYQGQLEPALIWQTLNITFAGSGVPCSYSIHPISLSFGSQGGSGTIDLGAVPGACPWTITKSDWITVSSPMSGTGDTTIAYTVQPNYGSQRTGTINAGGKTCTIIQGSAGTTSGLLKNPGFEDGFDNVAWVESSGYDIIWQEPCFTYTGINCAHGGEWIGWLGGYNNAFDTLEQTFTIPANVDSATLKFWYAIETEESDPFAYDFIYVTMTRVRDGFTKIILAKDNTDVTASWEQSGAYALPEFIGESVKLKFHVETDSSYVTSFFVDDVQVTTTTRVPTRGKVLPPAIRMLLLD